MTKQTLRDLVHRTIQDEDIIILRSNFDNKLICSGNWFQDWILDHMDDEVTHCLRVETCKVIVWVKDIYVYRVQKEIATLRDGKHFCLSSTIEYMAYDEKLRLNEWNLGLGVFTKDIPHGAYVRIKPLEEICKGSFDLKAYGYRVIGSKKALEDVRRKLSDKKASINWNLFRENDVYFDDNGKRYGIYADHDKKVVVLYEE